MKELQGSKLESLPLNRGGDNFPQPKTTDLEVNHANNREDDEKKPIHVQTSCCKETHSEVEIKAICFQIPKEVGHYFEEEYESRRVHSHREDTE